MASTLTSLLVHIIFSTKHRTPVIEQEFDAELHAYLGGVCRAEKCPALRVGGASDHVHLLVSLHKTVAVSELLLAIKKASSRWAHNRGKKDLSWQVGYAAFTIGRSAVPALVKYIAKQREHHKRVSFQDELRRISGLYGVELDERYAWD